MKKPNPRHAVVQCLPGQQLPADWKTSTNDHGGLYDRRPLSEMWRNVSGNKPEVDSPTRNARLQPLSWDELYGQK
jgi:hypothetical protein